MKTTIKTLLGLAAITSIVSSLSAFTIADANFRDTDLLQRELNALSPSTSGVFSLVGDDGDGRDLLGFDPDAHLVTDAIAGAVFAKRNQNGGISLLARLSFILGTSNVLVEGDPTLLSSWSQGVFTSGGNQEIIFSSNSLSGSIILEDIQSDGLLDWQVSIDPQNLAQGEDVILWGVYLGVAAERVPDAGSTAAMMGFGLFGVTFFASRFRQRSIQRN